ncbi:hypothetical protein CAMRE0001_0730 [Campylobacter rectus RM3267]|uniref:Uncharacterized protein n=1 Tax=Campylobacter rectus RM3267 TaxID=553218 RepID=B9CZP0_CAMRE|nr:hypothetical protein CAMRE0001_0730 [Campylobacter rectus RM3267]
MITAAELSQSFAFRRFLRLVRFVRAAFKSASYRLNLINLPLEIL